MLTSVLKHSFHKHLRTVYDDWFDAVTVSLKISIQGRT